MARGGIEAALGGRLAAGHFDGRQLGIGAGGLGHRFRRDARPQGAAGHDRPDRRRSAGRRQGRRGRMAEGRGPRGLGRGHAAHADQLRGDGAWPTTLLGCAGSITPHRTRPPELPAGLLL